jgi:type IV pilus assembly protein PilN
MRQINLLPPEIAQRRRVREITLMIGAAGLALVGLLVVILLVQTARVAGERGKLRDVKRQNAQLQAKVNELEIVAQNQAELANKQKLLATLTQNEVRWSVILNNISIRIPSDVWLTSFSGAVSAPAGPAAATTSFGTISLAGTTFTHLDVAKWLSRLEGINEWAFPYLTLSSKAGSDETGQVTVNFNSTVELSSGALRRNQQGGVRAL